MQHCVHLGNMTCSCGAGSSQVYPMFSCYCSHQSRAREPFDYLDKCYSKAMFIAAYSYQIEVVGSEEFWPNNGRGELLSPLPKAMPGRPRKARRRRKYDQKTPRLSSLARDETCIVEFAALLIVTQRHAL